MDTWFLEYLQFSPTPCKVVEYESVHIGDRLFVGRCWCISGHTSVREIGDMHNVLLHDLEKFFVRVWMTPAAHCWVEQHPEIVLANDLYDEFLSLSKRVSYAMYPHEDDGDTE